jgi:hypothetical protein
MSARLQAFERFQDKKKCKNDYGLVLKILCKNRGKPAPLPAAFHLKYSKCRANKSIAKKRVFF